MNHQLAYWHSGWRKSDYYAQDQIGSVRRVYTSGSAPAYDYDVYGNPLQTTPPLTDFGYAGMFYHANSGLDLTMYRAYNPVIGRWLSRDPLGETSDPQGNLYVYVGDNPVNWVDPMGLMFEPSPGSALPGDRFRPGDPPQNQPGGGLSCTASGDNNPPPPQLFAGTPNSGAPGSWYTNPGSAQMRQYDSNGDPQTDIDLDHNHGQGVPHAHNWEPNPTGEPGTRGSGLPVSIIPW